MKRSPYPSDDLGAPAPLKLKSGLRAAHNRDLNPDRRDGT